MSKAMKNSLEGAELEKQQPKISFQQLAQREGPGRWQVRRIFYLCNKRIRPGLHPELIGLAAVVSEIKINV